MNRLQSEFKTSKDLEYNWDECITGVNDNATEVLRRIKGDSAYRSENKEIDLALLREIQQLIEKRYISVATQILLAETAILHETGGRLPEDPQEMFAITLTALRRMKPDIDDEKKYYSAYLSKDEEDKLNGLSRVLSFLFLLDGMKGVDIGNPLDHVEFILNVDGYQNRELAERYCEVLRQIFTVASRGLKVGSVFDCLIYLRRGSRYHENPASALVYFLKVVDTARHGNIRLRLNDVTKYIDEFAKYGSSDLVRYYAETIARKYEHADSMSNIEDELRLAH